MTREPERCLLRHLSPVVVAACLAVAAPVSAEQPDELDDLQLVLDAVHQSPYDVRLALLAAGIGDVARRHGWEGTCGDALYTYSRASFDSREALVAEALEACPATCPAGLLRGPLMSRLGGLPEVLHTGVVASACDAEGPDPVFGGDLESLRAQMPLQEYWVFRAGFDQLGKRLDAIGGARAAALRTSYDKLAVEVAHRLSLHLPPPALALRVPATTSHWSARPSTAVTVTTDGIAIDGEPVCKLGGGVVSAEHLEGDRILPLADALSHPEQILLLQMDRDLSHQLGLQVIHTAARAGYTQFELAGINPELGRQCVARVSVPRVADPLGATGEVPERPPLSLVVVVDDEGFGITGSARSLGNGGDPVRLPLEDGQHPYASLTRLLAEVKDEFPDEEQFFVVTEGNVTYQALVSTLDASRLRLVEPGERPEPLFPFPVVVTAPFTVTTLHLRCVE